MNSKQIVGHIMIATGAPVSALAAKYDYNKQTFYDAMKGRTESKKVRQIISDTIGIPVSEIWPNERTGTLS